MAIRSYFLFAAFFHVARSFLASAVVANIKKIKGMANVFLLIWHRQWRKSHINPQLISPRAFNEEKAPK